MAYKYYEYQVGERKVNEINIAKSAYDRCCTLTSKNNLRSVRVKTFSRL